MRREFGFIALAAALLGVSASPLSAQQGFALKGFYILNATTAEEGSRENELPTEDGYGLGVEMVLPFGLGLGVSGYTAGETDEFDMETTELTVIGEANYFLDLPLLPVSPYAGVHAGLGVLAREDLRNPSQEIDIEDKTRSQLGFQVGVRFQPISLFGVDAQWRRMSTSATENQGGRLERDQFLIGITLF